MDTSTIYWFLLAVVYPALSTFAATIMLIVYLWHYSNVKDVAVIVPYKRTFVIQRLRDRKFYCDDAEFVDLPTYACQFSTADNAYQKAHKLRFKEIFLRLPQQT